MNYLLQAVFPLLWIERHHRAKDTPSFIPHVPSVGERLCHLICVCVFVKIKVFKRNKGICQEYSLLTLVKSTQRNYFHFFSIASSFVSYCHRCHHHHNHLHHITIIVLFRCFGKGCGQSQSRQAVMGKPCLVWRWEGMLHGPSPSSLHKPATRLCLSPTWRVK